MISRSWLARRVPLCVCVCGLAFPAVRATAGAAEEPPHSAALDAMIIKQAKRHGVPEKLVRRVVMRESRYNPRARNHSFWGLMQISYPTAKSMGFKGTPQELLNPVVNLTYAVPYLANAFVVAGRREDAAVRLYASGYYATAKHRGMLDILRTADSTPVSGQPELPELATAAAAPTPNYGIFGALLDPQQQQSQPQMVAYNAQSATSPPQAPPAESARATAAPPPDISSDEGVALTTDKNGALRPPKKWLHDGGVTMIARGEQSVDQIAAYEQTTGADTHRKTARGHGRKNTTFAAIESAPASAQAYAATAGGQDPHLTQAESQSAIQQVTLGQAAPPAAAPEQRAAAQPQATTESPATEEEPTKKHRRKRSARKSRGHDATDDSIARTVSPGSDARTADVQATDAADASRPQAAQ